MTKIVAGYDDVHGKPGFLNHITLYCLFFLIVLGMVQVQFTYVRGPLETYEVVYVKLILLL